MNIRYFVLPNNGTVVSDELGNMTINHYSGNVNEILLNENINEYRVNLNMEIKDKSDRINRCSRKHDKLNNNFRNIKLLEKVGFGGLLIFCLLINLLVSFSLTSIFASAVLTILYGTIIHSYNSSYVWHINNVSREIEDIVQEKDELMMKLNKLNDLVIEKKNIPVNQVVKLMDIDDLLMDRTENQVKVRKLMKYIKN